MTQVRRILNCIPSANREKDWQMSHAVAAGLLAANPPPPSVDLRAAWWTINDQGTTGSCVGWAAADSVLRWHFVKAGRLPKTQLLSTRFIWMAAKEVDEFSNRPTTFIEPEGTSLKAALDIARNFGCVTDADLPFKPGTLFPDPAETFYAKAAQLKIASYIAVARTVAEWKTWLAEKGPILTRLDVDKTWDDAKATKGKLDNYDPATTRGGHAVAIVGYTTDRFIIRNSWGTATWGDKGFGYASHAYALAAFTESYGVNIA